MKLPAFLALLLSLASSFLISTPLPLPSIDKEVPDTVYYNGNIVTMDEKHPYAKSVSVKNGKITKISNHSTIPRPHLRTKTEFIDLKKKTMVPGFVDAHSHFSATAVLLNLNFSIASPPFGNITSISQMLTNAKRYIKENKIPPG